MFDPDARAMLTHTGNDNLRALVDSSSKPFLMPQYANDTFGYQDPSICTFLFNFTACYPNPDGHKTYEGGA
jgi:hypothetical protein